MDSLEHAESETEEEQQEAPNSEDNTSTEESSHEKTPLTSSKTTKEKSGNPSSILSTFEHVLQFCYLCTKEKIYKQMIILIAPRFIGKDNLLGHNTPPLG